mmetsp:Transcript_23965/g.53944  ORF Transcript_23965/g.53944 Transcript_23965/m.53944 type:complete len:250 (+) Transcript_23965:413-1162(+)
MLRRVSCLLVEVIPLAFMARGFTELPGMRNPKRLDLGLTRLLVKVVEMPWFGRGLLSFPRRVVLLCRGLLAHLIVQDLHADRPLGSRLTCLLVVVVEPAGTGLGLHPLPDGSLLLVVRRHVVSGLTSVDVHEKEDAGLVSLLNPPPLPRHPRRQVRVDHHGLRSFSLPAFALPLVGPGPAPAVGPAVRALRAVLPTGVFLISSLPFSLGGLLLLFGLLLLKGCFFLLGQDVLARQHVGVDNQRLLQEFD